MSAEFVWRPKFHFSGSTGHFKTDFSIYYDRKNGSSSLNNRDRRGLNQNLRTFRKSGHFYLVKKIFSLVQAKLELSHRIRCGKTEVLK